MTALLLPIFGLVALGWACRRFGVLGPRTGAELSTYVVVLALPALLFDIVSHLDLRQLDRPGLAATFTLGSVVAFALLLFGRRRIDFADTALDALCASYPNTGFIGLPLALLVFGPAAGPGAAIIVVIASCVLYGMAVVVLEVAVNRSASPLATAATVLRSLLRNPVLLAPALALALAAGGWTLPHGVQRIAALLAASAGPCALLSLGLFLARGSATDHRDKVDAADAVAPSAGADGPGAFGDAGHSVPGGASVGAVSSSPAERWRRVAVITLVKLVVQPAVTALLAVRVFGLAPPETQLVVLMSALPTGTGAFVLAGFYRRDATVTSLAVLVTTVASAATLPVVLWLLR